MTEPEIQKQFQSSSYSTGRLQPQAVKMKSPCFAGFAGFAGTSHERGMEAKQCRGSRGSSAAGSSSVEVTGGTGQRRQGLRKR